MNNFDFAKLVHKDFVDSLYTRYGLTHHPGYSEIDLRWMVRAGSFAWFPNPTIFISARDGSEEIGDNSSMDEIFDTTCHETGHFLHCATNMGTREKKLTERNKFLAEIVADLGSLIFISEKYGSGRAERYLVNMNAHSTNVSYDIFKGNSHLLEVIANQDIRRANRLIRPLLERELYPDSLVRFFRGY